MGSQTQSGKAFEYAIVDRLEYLLSDQKILIRKDEQFLTAKKHYDSLDKINQKDCLQGALSGVQHLIELEPKISDQSLKEDCLGIYIQSSSTGTYGDPRDVTIVRQSQNWEVGISCKNNHNDLKHSRLSPKIDFGKDWINHPVSNQYWQDIKPTFLKIQKLKEQGFLVWQDWLSTQCQDNLNKNDLFVVPILDSFDKELKKLCAITGVPAKIVRYLVGIKDFYQVVNVPGQNHTKILAFNLYDTLNFPVWKNKKSIKVPVTKLPENLISTFRKGTTLEVYFDQGWSFKFRLHTASSKIETSLKFAVGLFGIPTSAYTNTCFWNHHKL